MQFLLFPSPYRRSINVDPFSPVQFLLYTSPCRRSPSVYPSPLQEVAGPLVSRMAFITRDSGGADDTAVPSFMTAVDDDPFASGPGPAL